MKKNFFALAILASFSFGAVAADNAGTAIPDNGLIQAAAAGCSLLTEDVTLNLSNNVFGAYACNTAANIVAIATCHPNGRKGNIAVDCDPVARAESSPGAGDGYTPPQGCTLKSNNQGPNDGTMTVQGGLAFSASSRGGRVQGVSAQNCRTGGNTTAEAATAANL